MPKLLDGSGGKDKSKKLIPPAESFNRKAHWREHYPQSSAGGFGESLMVSPNVDILDSGNSYTAFADFATGVTPVWDDGFTRSTGGIQIPTGLGGIYMITTEFEIPADTNLALDAYAMYSDLDPINDTPVVGPNEIFAVDNHPNSTSRIQITMSGIWYMPETWWISLRFKTNNIVTGFSPTIDVFGIARIGGIPANIDAGSYT